MSFSENGFRYIIHRFKENFCTPLTPLRDCTLSDCLVHMMVERALYVVEVNLYTNLFILALILQSGLSCNQRPLQFLIF